MAEFILGMNAKIYQGTVGSELSVLTEMSNVKDVSLNMEAGDADITTRANGGWRGTAPTLRECTAEFEMLWKPSDASFTAIKNAFMTNSTIELAILDQARDIDTAQGPKGSFSITNFSRNESLEEAIVVSVTAKLAVFDEWVEVVIP